MRERWCSGWAGCWQGRRGGLESSSLSPALISTRRSTSGPSPTMCRLRRSRTTNCTLLSGIEMCFLKILTKDSVTVYVNAIMYYKGSFDRPWSISSEYPCPGVWQQQGRVRRGWLQHIHPLPGSRDPQELSWNQKPRRNSLRKVRKLKSHFSVTPLLSLTKLFRDSIAREMKFVLDAATEPWGVLVERVEVKDVRWDTY